MAFSRLFSFFSGFWGQNFPNDPRKFSTLAVSKILGVTSSLPNLRITCAQSRHCVVTNQKSNKSNFNTSFSTGNKISGEMNIVACRVFIAANLLPLIRWSERHGLTM